jgi:taurine dehydrogenase small subunit
VTAFAATDATLALVQGVEAACNRRDVDAVLAVTTDDCVVEVVAPAGQGGGRWEGRAAVRTALTGLAAAFPGYAVETEDVFACGDRCARRWLLRWDRPEGGRGRLRGIDAYTVRDGKIARCSTYVAL